MVKQPLVPLKICWLTVTQNENLAQNLVSPHPTITMRAFTLALFVATSTTHVVVNAVDIPRKMVADWVPKGRRLTATTLVPTESSAYTVFIGSCSPDTPFKFPVSAGEGKGAIGLMDDTSVLVSLELDAGAVTLDSTKKANVFAAM